MVCNFKAEDILQMIARLSHKERRRMFWLALGKWETDAQTYTRQPLFDDEFSSDEDNLSWNAEGWEDAD